MFYREPNYKLFITDYISIPICKNTVLVVKKKKVVPEDNKTGSCNKFCTLFMFTGREPMYNHLPPTVITVYSLN